MGDGHTNSKGARCVSRSGPTPSTVQSKALISDDSEDSTPSEGFGVCLSLDLQDVEGKKNDFTDTDDTRNQNVSRCQICSPSSLTFQQRRTSLPFRSSLRRSARMCHRGSSPGSHGRKAVHRTCISVAGPGGSQSQHSNRANSFLTLYPAA